ncbi:hypothetical protein CHS0354_015690 [Potamilus streckersoni]|uniref:Reelin domain-containing protein n=1 Tax=Potamilus streckersoni TaxID=2493646 RepID=A0AAE0W0Q1_9BIVA|nr:hypothetical protein CHS0354_015690 [Potamilus streckersoni]
MKNLILAFILVLGHHISFVTGHSTGADPQACTTLRPGHGGTTNQLTPSPYSISTNIQGYVPCTTMSLPGQAMNCGVLVRISTNNLAGLNPMSSMFKGFILQAQYLNGQPVQGGEFRYTNEQPIMQQAIMNNQFIPNQINTNQFGLNTNQFVPNQIGTNQFGQNQIGTNQFGQNQFGMNNPFGVNNQFGINNQFGMMGGQSILKLLPCMSPTVTHTEPSGKNSIVLKWYPSPGLNQPVMFAATVAQDYRTYWMNLHSQALYPRPNYDMPTVGASLGGPWFSGATSATPSLVMFLGCLFYFLLFLF